MHVKNILIFLCSIEIDLAGVSNDRSRILKMLKRQRLKFRKLIDKQSLIGAEFVDFPRL